MNRLNLTTGQLFGLDIIADLFLMSHVVAQRLYIMTLHSSKSSLEAQEEIRKDYLRQCLMFARKAFLNDPKWRKGLLRAREAWKALKMDAEMEERNLRKTVEGVQEEVMASFCVI